MRSIHRLLPAFLLTLLVAGGCSGGKTLLRFHPHTGTYRYAMQQTVKGSLSGGGAGGPVVSAGEASINGQFREVVSGPREGGGVGVTWSIDTVTVTSPQQEMQARAESALATRIGRVQAMRFDVVYDDRMIPTKTQVTDPLGTADDQTRVSLRSAAHTFAFPLPLDPVAKGDEWRAADEFPLQGVTGTRPLDVQYILTVKDIRVGGADTTIIIGIGTKFPDTPLTMTERGVTVQAKVTGTATGQQEFNLSQGVLVSGTMDGNLRVEMTAPQLRMPIAMTFDLHITMRRVAGP